MRQDRWWEREFTRALTGRPSALGWWAVAVLVVVMGAWEGLKWLAGWWGR